METLVVKVLPRFSKPGQQLFFAHRKEAVMPPKKSKKAQAETKKKVVEDKTFGLKNKNKSKKVQQYVNTVKQQVSPGALDTCSPPSFLLLQIILCPWTAFILYSQSCLYILFFVSTCFFPLLPALFPILQINDFLNLFSTFHFCILFLISTCIFPMHPPALFPINVFLSQSFVATSYCNYVYFNYACYNYVC